jgi:tetratricopeptide (TPR) repeat protein
MRESIALLNTALDPLLQTYGGTRLDTHDAALAARFNDIFDAVDWALALSDALVEVDWPDALVSQEAGAEVFGEGEGEGPLFRGLRVGLGVDMGVVHTRIDAMTGRSLACGATLEAAGRLAGAAPTGGVRLGAAVVDLIAELADGEEQSWWLEQLAADTCEATVLPQRLARNAAHTPVPKPHDRRSNLPEPGGVFVDRVGEFNALGEALERARRVAICGPAGAGKSRLAVEFARAWLAHHDARSPARLAHSPARLEGAAEAWFCDLSEVQSTDEAVFSVARTTGVQIPRSEARDELDARLVAAIGERGPTLLVLDDVDALDDDFIDSVAHWLDGAQNLCVLTTRQRQPRADGEVVMVDALGRSAARALLEELLERPTPIPLDARAPHLRDPDNLLEVVDACGRLPLALELIARATPHRSGSAPAGLDDDAPRDELERALARSWQMLDPAQQAALQACTVFAGSFTAAAAVSVIGATVDADAEELFSMLCQFSLLRTAPQSGEAERHVLLAPVRDFVGARADEELVAAARRRHIDYYAQWAKTLRAHLEGGDERAWLDRAGAELANLYRAADNAGADHPRRLVTIVEGLAEVDVRVGPLGGFGERNDAAVAAAREAGEPGLLVRALRTRAKNRMWGGRYEPAEGDCREAYDLARELGDERVIAYTMSDLGFVLGMEGKEDESLPLVRQAAEMVRDDESFDVITVLTNAAIVARNRNEMDEATDYLHRALVRARRCENAFSQAAVLFFLGTILRQKQQWDEAIRYIDESRELFESVGDRRGRLVTSHELAACYTATDQFELAEQCYAEAMELASSMGDREHTAVFFLGRGRSRFARGDYAAAESDLLEASIAVEEAGHIHLKIAILVCLAATYGALERTGEAKRYFERVEQIFEETDIARERSLFEVMYGYLDAAHARAAMRRGDEAEARRKLRDAYERADATPELPVARHEAQNLLTYLDARVEAGELPAGASPKRSVLRVCEETRWFAVDDAEPVDISRRGPIRRILRALVDRRLEAPGETMTSDEIVAAGWPDEVLTAQSASQRLYTTISRMRALGLQDVLETFDGEYLISPVYTPVWVERS